jgi:hypothetical protein
MMWKEAVMAYFRVLSLQLPEENKNKHKNLGSESLFPNPDSNQRLANTNQRNYASTNSFIHVYGFGKCDYIDMCSGFEH